MIDIEIHIRQKLHHGYPVEIRLGNQQHFVGIIPETILDAAGAHTPLEIGDALFHTLFYDTEPQHAWYRTTSHPHKRIRLWIDKEVNALNRMSWECLYDGDSFLSANARTPFSRYYATQHPWGETLAVRPVQMLVAVSAPQANSALELPTIHPELEYDIFLSLKNILPAGLLDIEFLEPPVSLNRLERKLQDDTGFHILHIIAHGHENYVTHQSQIILQDRDGGAKVLPIQDFARMIARQFHKPQLVFLGSCSSSHNTVPPLMNAGIPAVIAMQDTIGVEAARQMTYDFYLKLFGDSSYGVVDLALNQARSLLLSAKQGEADVPVIYMRLNEGRLFTHEKIERTEDVLFQRMQHPFFMTTDEISNLGQAKGIFLKQLSHMLTFRDMGTPVHYNKPVKYLVGRKSFIHNVITVLSPGKIVTLYGREGIGKSAIASEVAWILSPDGKASADFPDGIITYSFYNQPDIMLAIDHIIRKFIRYADDNSLEALQSIMHHKRALIILEDTEQADNLSVLLEDIGQCSFLLTAQSQQNLLGTRMEVPPLSEDTLRTLFSTIAGQTVKKPAADAIVSNIIRRFDGLPLAVTLAGCYLRYSNETPERFLDWLNTEYGFGIINSLLHRTINHLREIEKSILAATSVLALAPFNPAMLVYVLQTDHTEIRQALNRLVNYGLLRHVGGMYQLRHASIYQYAMENLILPGENVRLLTEYFTTIFDVEAESNLNRFKQLEDELVHMHKHIRDLSDAYSWLDVVHLIQKVDSLLDLLGHWGVRKEVLETTVQNLVTNRQIAPAHIQELLVKWNSVCQKLGNDNQVADHIEKILEDMKHCENQWGVAHMYLYLGIVNMENKDWSAANRYNRLALKMMRRIENTPGMAHAYSNIFKLHQQRNAWKQAHNSYKKYLQIDGERLTNVISSI